MAETATSTRVTSKHSTVNTKWQQEILDGVIETRLLFPSVLFDESMCKQVLSAELVSKEILDGVIDTRYFFPSVPFDESMCKQVLSAELVSNADKPYFARVNIENVTGQVEDALSDADARMFGKNKPSKLDKDSLDGLLAIKPHLSRKDGRAVIPRNDFLGKYIMACTLSVPDCWNSPAWELANKSVKLYSQRKDDFELILLIRQRHGWEKYAHFDDFLEPFHPSCIVYHLPPNLSNCIMDNRALVVDPNGNVLFERLVSSLSEIGSEAFPFTDADVSSVVEKYSQLKLSSLEFFLGVEPSYKVFRKLPGTVPLQKEWMCISEFQSKIVFLYTYTCGDRLGFLYNTVISLREKGMEFEIITAYAPCSDYHNPRQFFEVFSSLVAQRGLSWWVLPPDSSTYFRLRTLYATNTISDLLIVFDPKLDDGDPHGLEVMRLYGESVFPFTKMSAAEHVIKELTQVTLQSFFVPITHLLKEDVGDEYDNNVVEKSVLTGKNVLVYFDSYEAGDRALDQFVSWYESLEGKRCNFEVVCVYLDTCQQEEYNVGLRHGFPKWLILPNDEKVHSNYVVDNFFMKLFKHRFPTFFAFGKDGKICSLLAHRLLSYSDAVNFSFNGDIPREIFNILNDHFVSRLDPYPDFMQKKRHYFIA